MVRYIRLRFYQGDIVRNIIQEELELAKSKMFEEVIYKDKTLVKLTRDNVAIVEAMIRNDSAYIHSSDKNAKPVYSRNNTIKYGGSTAYWMTQLKYILTPCDLSADYSYEDIIKSAVESVDRENSTHLNADGIGRFEITKRIQEFDRSELIECLKNPDYKDMLLVQEISKITSAQNRARHNISLQVNSVITLVFIFLRVQNTKIIIQFMIAFSKLFFQCIWIIIKLIKTIL